MPPRETYKLNLSKIKSDITEHNAQYGYQ